MMAVAADPRGWWGRRILFRVLSIYLLLRFASTAHLPGLPQPILALLAGIGGLVALYLLAHQIGEATEWFGAKADQLGLRSGINGFIRRHRVLSFALLLVSGTLAGWGAWAFYASRTAVAPAPATALLVDYEIPGTMARPQRGQKIFMLHFRSGGANWMVSTSREWGSGSYNEVDLPTAYYCTVRNEGNASLLELDLVYSAKFFDGVPGSAPVSTRTVHLKWPALAPNDSFGFYVVNADRLALSVEPGAVWGKVFGREKPQRIDVVQGHWAGTNLVFPAGHPLMEVQ